ncbi:MAG: transketolase [Clostridiales bacterium]|jgi:transketolase|nr:transketolase [Clostridiales bacterium]
MDIRELEIFAARIRLETTKMIGIRGFGHLSGSLSVADVLAVLYGGFMRIRPEEPGWPGRDKLVLSKGHAGPALYSALAMRGFFPMDWLATLNQPGTRLPSHCDRLLTPGVDMTTGSLGQGASAAAGLALAQKMDNLDSRTFLILGDGECNEGQVWEAALFANQYKLSNLIAFVDYNKKQLDGTTAEVMDMGDISAKFASFGWHTQNIDGGCVKSILAALNAVSADAPSCIVLNTIKGAKVPTVEKIEYNHHIVVEGDLLAAAIAECELELQKLEVRG